MTTAAKVIPPLTFVSTIDGGTNADGSRKRIASGLVDVASLALFTVSMKATKNITIKIYQHHVGLPANSDPANNLLVYQETVAKNTVFYKRFTIKGNFAQFELLNEEDTTASVRLTTCGLTIPNFEAQTFLNSTIGINDNSALSRNANDFNLDLIRGVHSSFSKINVLGISTLHQTETIGLNQLS